MVVQSVREIEQKICLESLARFVNSVDGIGTDQEALNVIKQWPMHNLEAFHLVSTPPSTRSSCAAICLLHNPCIVQHKNFKTGILGAFSMQPSAACLSHAGCLMTGVSLLCMCLSKAATTVHDR